MSRRSWVVRACAPTFESHLEQPFFFCLYSGTDAPKSDPRDGFVSVIQGLGREKGGKRARLGSLEM